MLSTATISATNASAKCCANEPPSMRRSCWIWEEPCSDPSSSCVSCQASHLRQDDLFLGERREAGWPPARGGCLIWELAAHAGSFLMEETTKWTPPPSIPVSKPSRGKPDPIPIPITPTSSWYEIPGG